MGYQDHSGTYVKILEGKYTGKYGECGYSSSDHDLLEVYPLGVHDKVLVDLYDGAETIKCPAQIKAIKLLYGAKNE